MKKKYLIFISLFLSLLSHSQNMLYHISMSEKVSNSELIVEGKVISKETYKSSDDKHIFTVNSIEILKIFKGNKSQRKIDVITKGGSYGDRSEVVNPSLQLHVGEIGTFMLNADGRNLKEYKTNAVKFHTYAGIQGFYKYDEYDNSIYCPFEKYFGIKSNFYSKITHLTKNNIYRLKDYIFKFEKQFKQLKALAVDSFTPTELRAGTGQLLTINGSNFGNTKGLVAFRDPDNGGETFLNVLPNDIESWTDTQIIVKVPGDAGTGTFRIFPAGGGLIDSSGPLTILSSETNAVFDIDGTPTSFRRKLVDLQNRGGYEWTYNRDFFNNKPAVNSFERAVNSWICATNINWTVNTNTTTINETGEDNINIVIFKDPGEDSNDAIEPGTLGVASSLFGTCEGTDGSTIVIIAEMDIAFNSVVNWNFSEETPDFGEISFEGTAAHELGHAHNLNHVIDDGALMHWVTSSGPASATVEIDANAAIGAELNYTFSKQGPFCRNIQIEALEDKDCPGLSVDNFPVTEEIESKTPVIFQTSTTIEVDNLEINNLSIFDLSGKKISKLKSNSIPTFQLSRGIYLLRIEAVNGDISFNKFIY